jgi:hypothetical protein
MVKPSPRKNMVGVPKILLSCRYNPPARHPYIGDVCLVAKLGLGLGTKMFGKHLTPHTKEAHERYLMSKV